MSSLLKIGELAQQTGLSIRTLHYYDEIGLLSPSHRNEVGHRLYSVEDIMRLQQIVSLRQLRFSLKEIRECLDNPAFSLPKVIDLHRGRIREQMALSRTLIERLNGIARQLESTQAVAIENLIEAMETIAMTEQYFTPEQQSAIATRFQEKEAQWQEMLGLARDVMSQEIGFNSVKVQALAQYWQQLMQFIIGGDSEIYGSLAQL
ncbi:MAG: MerR family transcriptional regulator [Cyanobacteriota bacterium]|nr:MerR family transcriptional regulator [Cyanobacteriota bacterium]